MTPAVWNAFHDGILTSISGAVPGDVRLRISITYLRRMFSRKGRRFVVNLRECTKLVWLPQDGAPITDLVVIKKQRIEILSVAVEDPLTLECVAGPMWDRGSLLLQFKSMEIALDYGQPVSEDQLVSASLRYWNAWAKRSDELRRKHSESEKGV